MRPSQDSGKKKVAELFRKLDAVEVWAAAKKEETRDQDGGYPSSSEQLGSSSRLGPIQTAAAAEAKAKKDAQVHEIRGMKWRRAKLCGARPETENSSSRHHAESGNFMSLEKLHKQIHDMENESTAPRPARRQTPGEKRLSAHLADHDGTGRTQEDEHEGPRKKFSLVTYAQSKNLDSEDLDGVGSLEGGLAGGARAARKRALEEQRAMRHQSRAKRQEAADVARVDFGMTTKEKKERSNREARLEQQALAASQATAVSDFRLRAARIFIANIIALITQMAFIYDVYQDKPATGSMVHYQPAAPAIVLIYTLGGITGSVLALLSVTVLFAVLVSEGIKAKSLQTICPLSVIFQYISAFLQLLSMFNHIGYSSVTIERLSANFPGINTLWTFIIGAEMVMVPVLPFIMAFTIYQTKQMCYVNLKKMISAEVIQSYIFKSVGCCQILSSSLVLSTSGFNYATLNEFLRATGSVDADNGRILRWDDLIQNYVYYVIPCLALVGLCLGMFYLSTTRAMYLYELETLALEEKKELTTLAGQRVSLTKGTMCKLQHIVDKPFLNGKRAIIESVVPDQAGLVSVNCEGRVFKAEEFQLTVLTDEKKLETVKERGMLKTAELVYKFELRGRSLQIKQSVYVTLGQVMCGLLIFLIGVTVTQTRFNALTIFKGLDTTLDTHWNTDDAAMQVRERAVQRMTCSEWSTCFADSPASHICGSCVIPTPVFLTASQLEKVPFADGSLFSGNSYTYMLVGGGIGAAVGILCGILFMRCVGEMGVVTTGITSLFIGALFSFLVLAIVPLPATLSASEVENGICDFLDIDPTAPGKQRVSKECLKTASAWFAGGFETDAKLSITGCLVNMFVFIFESLFNLAAAIRGAIGPTRWAKFEVKVFIYYFIFVACLLLGANILTDVYTFDDSLHDMYRNTTTFARAKSEEYGPTFPLLYNQTWELERLMQVGNGFWFNLPLSGPTLCVVLVIQIIGVISTKMAEIVWVRVLRFVLVIDAIICLAVYVAMAFLSFQAVDLVHNFITICTVPLCVQFVFAVFYALQSDILPFNDYAPENPVLWGVAAIVTSIPFVALAMISLGLSYRIFYLWGGAYTADQLAANSAVVLTGTILMIFFLLGAAAVLSVLIGRYYNDWTQMAADELALRFPKHFAAPLTPKDPKQGGGNDEHDEV